MDNQPKSNFINLKNEMIVKFGKDNKDIQEIIHHCYCAGRYDAENETKQFIEDTKDKMKDINSYLDSWTTKNLLELNPKYKAFKDS